MVDPAAQDWGDQLKFVMGMSSVDLSVLWPKNYGQYDVCYKPTSRLSQASLSAARTHHVTLQHLSFSRLCPVAL